MTPSEKAATVEPTLRHASQGGQPRGEGGLSLGTSPAGTTAPPIARGYGADAVPDRTAHGRPGWRLPGGAGVPVLSLLRTRWVWVLLAAVAGLVPGVLAGGSGAVAASATLRLASSQDSQRTQQVGQTVEEQALSSPVLDAAAKVRRTTRQDLAARVTAVWQDNTDLVSVTVTGTDPAGVVADANAVADAVVAQEQADAAARLTALRRESARVLASGTLSDRAAEQARRAALGSALASRQDDAAAGAEAVYVSDPATEAVRAGPSKVVTAGLGLVGGLALGGALALLVPAGLARFRRSETLVSLAPDLAVRDFAEAAPEVAGRVLGSDQHTLVVLGAPTAAAAASRFADVVASLLRGHGRTVTLVDGLTATLDSMPGTPPEVLRVLRHSVRDDVRGAFGTDLLVVACEAHGDALGMVAGQRDLTVAVVTRRAATRLGELRGIVSATAAAAPTVVVAA